MFLADDFLNGLLALSLVDDALNVIGEKLGIRSNIGTTTESITGTVINEARDYARSYIDIAAAQRFEVLDNRTCPLCESIHELIIDINDPDYAAYTYPHDRCRGVWIYIRREEEGWEELVDWKSPDPETINDFYNTIGKNKILVDSIDAKRQQLIDDFRSDKISQETLIEERNNINNILKELRDKEAE